MFHSNIGIIHVCQVPFALCTPRYHDIVVESVKTTSMEKESTAVLGKAKELLHMSEAMYISVIGFQRTSTKTKIFQ